MTATGDPLQTTLPLFADAGGSLPVAVRREGGHLPVDRPIAVEDAPAHSPRLLLVGEAGSGKSVALARIAAASEGAYLVTLDGTQGLGSMATPALPGGLLLVDGLEKLDEAQRGAALTELIRLGNANPELRYVTALRPESVLPDVPGDVIGLRPLTPAQITQAMRAGAGDDLARKAFRSSEDMILDLGRRPLYVVFLLEVLLGYRNLPPTREKLLRALVDHRIDQEVAAGLTARDMPWQMREPLAGLAWELVASPLGTHRVAETDVRQAFGRALAKQGAAGDGSQELEVVRRAGLLQDAPGGTLTFPTSELESWFAAYEISHRIQYNGDAEFLPVDNPRCHEPIILAAAQLEDASILLRHCLRLGQDLLVAHCLRANRAASAGGPEQREAAPADGRPTPEAEVRQFENAFLTRLGSGLGARAEPADRERNLTALAVLDSTVARQRLVDTIRAAIAPPRQPVKSDRRRGERAATVPQPTELDEETLRLLPERLQPFLPALSHQPPSGQRRLIAQLARTRKEHEFLAAAHLVRLLALDLDPELVGTLMQFDARGHRHMQQLLSTLGGSVVGRYLVELLEEPEIIRNPFPLGRMLRAERTPEATEALLEAMENPDERVRQVPVFVLAGDGDPVAMGEVEASATSAHDSRRWFAAAALEGVTTGNAIQILEKLADDGTPRVRKQARTSLQASKRQQAWQELTPVIEALGETPEPAACLEVAQQALQHGGQPALALAVASLSEGGWAALASGISASVLGAAEAPTSGAAAGSDAAAGSEAPEGTPTEREAEHEAGTAGAETEGGHRRRQGRRRQGRRRKTLSAGQQVLEALEEKWQRRAVSDPSLARHLMESGRVGRFLATCCLERLVEDEFAQAGRMLPIEADHPSIQAALESSWRHHSPRGTGDEDGERAFPSAGDVLAGRLGVKPGTLCEVLRRCLLRGEVAGAPIDDPDAAAWALRSLHEIGGERELLRLVSDPLFGQVELPNLRAELERRRLIPSSGAIPAPLISVAARRASEWFGRDRGRGKATGGFPESDVEVRVDPWPYLWFRRFAPPQRKSELGAALANLLARDESTDRRDRNLRLIRKLDGGLLPRAQKAAGIEIEPKRKKRARGGGTAAPEGAAAPSPASTSPEAVPPVAAAEASASAAPAAPTATAPPPAAPPAAPSPAAASAPASAPASPPAAAPAPAASPTSAAPPAPSRAPTAAAGREGGPRGRPGGRGRGGGKPSGRRDGATGRPKTAGRPPEPPKPKKKEPETLVELLGSWWAARTEVAATGRGGKRRGRKGDHQRVRELIDAVTSGERKAREQDSGVLSALVALAPSDEDTRRLLAVPEVHAAASADVAANPDAPWSREARRRIEQGSA